MKTILLSVFAVIFSVSSFANSNLKLKKVSTLGPMNLKVIYQSPVLTKTKSKEIYTGKLVVRWGVHVYEVVKATYACKKNECVLADYTRLATYESCKVKNDKVACSKKISGNSNEVVGVDFQVSSALDYEASENERRDNRAESEFPDRSNEEFADIF